MTHYYIQITSKETTDCDRLNDSSTHDESLASARQLISLVVLTLRKALCVFIEFTKYLFSLLDGFPRAEGYSIPCQNANAVGRKTHKDWANTGTCDGSLMYPSSIKAI